jgi:hypothetical protein
MLSVLHSIAGYPPARLHDISHTKPDDICSMAAINALYADIYMAVVPVGHNVFLAALPSSAATGAVR